VVTDVSDAQARAIAQETSAEQIKPDTELVAPTIGGQPDTSSPGAPQRREPTPADPQDGRQTRQRSGQASPSIGEQQAGKQGTA
jgi:hypothetical protein